MAKISWEFSRGSDETLSQRSFYQQNEFLRHFRCDGDYAKFNKKFTTIVEKGITYFFPSQEKSVKEAFEECFANKVMLLSKVFNKKKSYSQDENLALKEIVRSLVKSENATMGRSFVPFAVEYNAVHGLPTGKRLRLFKLESSLEKSREQELLAQPSIDSSSAMQDPPNVTLGENTPMSQTGGDNSFAQGSTSLETGLLGMLEDADPAEYFEGLGDVSNPSTTFNKTQANRLTGYERGQTQ